MKKQLLLILTITAMIAGCSEPADSSEAEFTKAQLPVNAREVTVLGNNWITFKLNVEGKDRSFMYHGEGLGSRYAHECITELNP